MPPDSAGLRQWGYRGQVSELTDEQWAEVEKELARQPYHRAREVATFVKERFHIAYTERGMQALLRRKGDRCIKPAWSMAIRLRKVSKKP